MFIRKKINNLLNKDIIYHYTSAETALNCILSNKNLKPSQLKKTNDPIEYKPQQIGSNYPIGHKEAENKSFEIRNKIKKIRSETKFISFCQNKNYNIKKLKKELKNKLNNKGFYFKDEDNKFIKSLGCILPRMWSQYGHQHKGICLAFSRQKLEQEIANKLKNKEKTKMFFDKITYKEFPVIDRSALITEISGNNIDIEKYVEKFIYKNYKELFFKKHKDYRDENEYRLVIYDPKNSIEYINIISSLEAIIIGDNFDKSKYESTINDFVEKYSVFSCEIYWANGTLNFE